MTQTSARQIVTADMLHAAIVAMAEAMLSNDRHAAHRAIDQGVGMWHHAVEDVRAQARLMAQEA
jgi:hypothetical protein